jgi:xanthine dehydrogenase accessory factor
MIEHFDQTEESLAAMRGPIGLYIGSKMPSEIAVSIMAGVLAVNDSVSLPRDAQVGPAKHQLQPRSADEDGAVCFSASRPG